MAPFSSHLQAHKTVAVGPWGGSGGSPFDDGVYTGLKQIVIVMGSGIDSITFEYDRDGASIWSQKHGGNGGHKTEKIELDFPKEYLTSMSGHYGPIHHGGPSIIRSLTFESNFKKYGPYGVEHGNCFTFPMSGGKIVGFHGRCGWFLDSIGLYLSPIHSANHVSSPDLSLVPASPDMSRSVSLKSQDGGATSKTYNILLALGESKDNVNLQYAKLDSIAENSPSITSFQSRRIDNFSPKVLPAYGSEKSMSVKAPVAYGPWGGNSGSIFDDGVYTGVRQIVLNRGAGIASIQIEYDRNGLSIWGNRHGGTSSGFKTNKIVFDYPFEILTAITGYYGSVLMMGPTIVKSLTFHTSKGKYGPYGEEQGIFFSSKLAEGMIIGFHGRKGWLLDSIGVHVLEGPIPRRSFAIDDIDSDSNGERSIWSNKMVAMRDTKYEEVIHGVVREPTPMGPGPLGGDGGKPWDDGVFSGIKRIVIVRGEVIHSIKIEYDRNGQSVWSMRHGGSGTNLTTHRIKFDYPNEVLTCINGYYSKYPNESSPKIIKSLSFYSSRGKYGPFGEEFGKFFTSTQTSGKVVGFHGRSGTYLNAIGVHMQHWLGNDQKTSTRSKFSKFMSGTKESLAMF